MLKLTRFSITLFIYVLFITFFVQPLYSQDSSFKLKGIVRDTEGNLLLGTTIQIKDTHIGTVSDINGEYEILIPDNNRILIVSYLGYLTREINVGNNHNLDIILDNASTQIDEVVVVGYSTQKKVSITGAVSSVNSKDLLKSHSPNLANSLAGKITGMSSSQTMGGQPGVDKSRMYLRGAGTTNVTDPLILIDGVPRDNINTLDLNEVESVSVLKDASATAVFGVRGANGVILITTRRGEEGKAKLSVNANHSYATFAKQPSRLHSVDYLNLRNEALKNDGMETINQDIIDLYRDPLKGLDPNDPEYATKAANRKYLYCDNDQYRMMFKEFAPQTTVNINVSGGTERLKYFLSAGFINQEGHLKTEPKSKLGYDPSSRMDRWSFRSNLDYQLTKSLKAQLNLGTYIENVGMPAAWSYGDDTYLMMRGTFFYTSLLTPISPGPTTIGGHGAPEGMILLPYHISNGAYLSPTPYETTNRFGYYNTVNTTLNSSFAMEWDLGSLITKGLVLRGLLSYDANAGSNTHGVKREKQYKLVIGSDGESFNYANAFDGDFNMTVYKNARTMYKVNAQAILSYNRSFDNHNVGGTFVAQRDHWESFASELPYNVIGFAGRATYNYDNRYFAEANIGYNGSEQFSPEERFGLFPAISAGWAVSNEKWLKNNEILTHLKLRASWGKVGNDQMGAARFLYMDQIQINGGGYLPSLGLGSTVQENQLGNQNITWETAKKFNMGLDFGILNSLTCAIDIFKEVRSDILIQRNTLPGFQGVPINNIPKVNMGIVDNKGIEFEFTYNKEIVKNLNLTLKGNIGLNKNIVKFADEIKRNDEYAYKYRITGYSLGQNFGYEIDWKKNGGYWNKELLVNNTLDYQFGTPRLGDFIYKDLNEDGRISEEDMAPIGKGSVPRQSYGLTLGLDYKGIDFSIFFQGLGGYHMTYQGNMVFENISMGSYFDYHHNAWTEDRAKNGERITYPALSTKSTVSHQPNSFFIQDKSFTRLKNLELGYTLPKNALKCLSVTNMRIYVSGQNLFTWSKLKSNHLDPEPFDAMSYPVTKTYNLGLNISF